MIRGGLDSSTLIIAAVCVSVSQTVKTQKELNRPNKFVAGPGTGRVEMISQWNVTGSEFRYCSDSYMLLGRDLDSLR